jgi:hypothetical protein
MCALAGDVHARHIKRLSHHDIIDRKTEEVTKAVLADIRRSEKRFIGVGAVASVVTTTGWKRLLPEQRRQQGQANQCRAESRACSQSGSPNLKRQKVAHEPYSSDI